jgi:hypothetical protein
MDRFKKCCVVVFSVLSTGSVFYGVHHALHSSLFTIHAVEVVAVDDEPPFNNSLITQLAAIPVGKANLFDLDLKSVESRLLANEWVQDVRIQRKLPRSVVISIAYKKPQAVLQTGKGAFSYVDGEGKVFSSLNLNRNYDIPLLLGFSPRSEKLKEALKLIESWKNSPVNQFSLISSVHWDSERGYRILVAYPLGKTFFGIQPNFNSQARTMIDLGHDLDSGLETKMAQLSSVFRYLSESSIVVRQVWADGGKKVVVKTVRGS